MKEAYKQSATQSGTIVNAIVWLCEPERRAGVVLMLVCFSSKDIDTLKYVGYTYYLTRERCMLT